MILVGIHAVCIPSREDGVQVAPWRMWNHPHFLSVYSVMENIGWSVNVPANLKSAGKRECQHGMEHGQAL